MTFGSTPASSFTVNSPTQITATAPAGTGLVEVRVTAAGGMTGNAGTADDYRFLNPATATLVFTSPVVAPNSTAQAVLTVTNPNPQGNLTEIEFELGGLTNLTFTPSASSLTACAAGVAPGASCSLVLAFTTAGSAGTGTANVLLRTSGGISSVSPANVTIAAAPTVADISGVTVGYNSSGQDITLQPSGLFDRLQLVDSPSHGSVTLNGTTATYVPNPGYFGTDSFTYTASGIGGTSAPATVSLTVAAPPAPEVANLSGVEVAFDSTGTDIDLMNQVSGVYTGLSIASQPAHGVATLSGTVVTYRPTAGYFGPDSFTVTATGPGGTSREATVSLTVATPPPPVVTPPPPVVTPTPSGGSGEVTVDLGDYAGGVVTGFRITQSPTNGTAQIVSDTPPAAPSGSGPDFSSVVSFSLSYTPAPNFLGTDSVTLVAFGPGGDSAPATFTFQVPGQAPDLSVQVVSDASVTISPTAGLVGGPFTGIRVTRQPDFGTVSVQGLDLVFTPGVTNGGATSFDYVVDLPFGASAAGTVNVVSNLVPQTQALTAATLTGVPVTVRITNGVAGGPFTGASVVSVAGSATGTAAISSPSAGVYDLTFTPTGTTSGSAVVTYSLANAFGSSTGTVTVTVEARPDPSLDPEVRGLVTSQVGSARRFADAQIGNFHRRLESLRDGRNEADMGLTMNFGVGRDRAERDPRTALARRLGLAEDRFGEMEELIPLPGTETVSLFDGHDAPRASSGEPSALGIWAAGSIDWGRQNAAGQRDYRFTTQGVTVGVDMAISDTLIVGGGVGYGYDRTEIGDNGSLSRANSVTGAVYLSWRPAPTLYVEGVAGYVDLDFESRRWVQGLGGAPDAFALGDRAGDVTFVSASLGRRFEDETSAREHYARLGVRAVTLEAFTETGAGLSALAWDELSQDSVSLTLGTRWRWVADMDGRGVLMPSVRLEWTHEFEDLGDQGVRYADWAASPTYLVPLDGWSRDSLGVELGGDWRLGGVTVSTGYRGQLGKESSSHGLEMRVRVGW